MRTINSKLKQSIETFYELKRESPIMSLKKAIEVRDDCIFIKSAVLKPKQRVKIITDNGYERTLVKTKNDKLILN